MAASGFTRFARPNCQKRSVDRFAFCLGELKGIDVCPMKRDPAPLISGRKPEMEEGLPVWTGRKNDGFFPPIPRWFTGAGPGPGFR